MADRHAVILPILGSSAKHAIMRAWHKNARDRVVIGTILCTVEAKKTTYDIEADADGFLTPLVEVGKPSKTGAPVAVLSSVAEEIDAVLEWVEECQPAADY